MAVKEGLVFFRPEPSKGYPYPTPIKASDTFDFHISQMKTVLDTMQKQLELIRTTKRAYSRANNDEIKQIIREIFRRNLIAFSGFYSTLGDLVKGLTG
jgi:hypothetical protein